MSDSAALTSRTCKPEPSEQGVIEIAQSNSSSGDDNTVDSSLHGLTDDDNDAMNGSGVDGHSVDGEGSVDDDGSDVDYVPSDREDISDNEYDANELKSELTQVNRDFQVRYWWEAVKGVETDFTFDYIRDTSLPWFGRRNAHCFLRPPSSFLQDGATAAEREEASDKFRKDFTAVIASRMFEFYSTPLEQPVVFWNGNNIAVRSECQRFLEDLWQRPPVLYGESLAFVSKAPPFNDMNVFTSEYVPVIKKEDFVAKLENDLNALTRPGVQLVNVQYSVLARFYQVEDLPGGPMSAGELLFLCSFVPRRYTPMLLNVHLARREYRN